MDKSIALNTALELHNHGAVFIPLNGKTPAGKWKKPGATGTTPDCYIGLSRHDIEVFFNKIPGVTPIYSSIALIPASAGLAVFDVDKGDPATLYEVLKANDTPFTIAHEGAHIFARANFPDITKATQNEYKGTIYDFIHNGGYVKIYDDSWNAIIEAQELGTELPRKLALHFTKRKRVSTTAPKADWSEGNRNDTLNKKLFQLYANGHKDGSAPIRAVLDKAREVGLDEAEIETTRASAREAGASEATQDVPLDYVEIQDFRAESIIDAIHQRGWRIRHNLLGDVPEIKQGDNKWTQMNAGEEAILRTDLESNAGILHRQRKCRMAMGHTRKMVSRHTRNTPPQPIRPRAALAGKTAPLGRRRPHPLLSRILPRCRHRGQQ